MEVITAMKFVPGFYERSSAFVLDLRSQRVAVLWMPGVIHALYAIMNDEADERVTRIINAIRPPAPPQPPSWVPKLSGTALKALPSTQGSLKISTPAQVDARSFKLTKWETASEKGGEASRDEAPPE